MKTQTITVSWPWYGAGSEGATYKVESITNSTAYKPDAKLTEEEVKHLCAKPAWTVKIVKSH